MTARTLKDGTQSEKAFSQQVYDFARLHRWKVYRTWNSIHSPAGFPDLCMTKGGRLVFAELKAEKGRVTADQTEWITALQGCLPDVYVWRPSDWDTIVGVLGGSNAS